MEKTYQPQQLEQKWYQTWEQHQYFKPSLHGTPYCIMIPPPNVTGRLHMGHGFQQTIMDALIRYHRMSGFDTLWQPGTDHAGIATQMVVERQLAQQNISRHDIGREQFVDKVWEWKERSGGFITQQQRRLGVSVDWSRERFTMDESLSRAVQAVFIRLYDEGLIVRGKRLVNWDPALLTAISDLEVITQEEQGHLWHMRYPLADNSGQLVVATTRPETMLGDTAVAVHPDDERYQHLIGQSIKLPLTDRIIPIIADDYVDREFGSGCVKITPAHDFNDNAIGQRHNLELINVFTPDAKINENAPKQYRGLDRFEARKTIVADLEKLGLLEKIDDHKLSIPRGDRSGQIIEPYLTDQWYMKMDTLAKPALDAVRQGKIRFVPDNWTKIYYQWLDNIEDWCISRQLWWGHRIPAWYDDKGTAYVGENEHHIREKYQLDNQVTLTQDNDVLDTWFSSALWPFSTLGWPEQTEELKRYYPTNVLVTGFDIIFFWVARMIMLGLKFTDDIPFKEVFIHGLILDSHGQKMSKSKGNIIDPIDLIDGIELEPLIEKRTTGMMQPHLADKIAKLTRQEFPEGITAYGTDALRFTFCALATPGREIRFDIKRLEANRNFCNKLWNATRYVLMNTENYKSAEIFDLQLADHWILSRLQTTIKTAHKHYKHYRFDLLTKILYEFVWHDFCDWYLEFSKPTLYDTEASDNVIAGARYTLLTVLETSLRLLHPLMPFITEDIWQRVAPLLDKKANTIMLQAYPEYEKSHFNEKTERDIEWLQNIIVEIRNIRGETNISPSKTIPLLLKGSKDDQSRLSITQSLLVKLAKIESITWLKDNEQGENCAQAFVDQLEILIPLKGLIDVKAETERLQKAIAKLDKELVQIQGRLNNQKFVANAPKAVVAKEEARRSELEETLQKFTFQLNNINN